MNLQNSKSMSVCCHFIILVELTLVLLYNGCHGRTSKILVPKVWIFFPRFGKLPVKLVKYFHAKNNFVLMYTISDMLS